MGGGEASPVPPSLDETLLEARKVEGTTTITALCMTITVLQGGFDQFLVSGRNLGSEVARTLEFSLQHVNLYSGTPKCRHFWDQ